MTEYEVVSLVVQAVTALLIFGSLVYAGRQVHQARLANDRDHDWNRRKSAQDVISDFAAGKMAEARTKLRTECDINPEDMNETYQEISNKLTSKQKEVMQDNIDILFNYFEHIACGLRYNIYDKQMIRSYFQVIIPKWEEWANQYIEEKRVKIGPIVWEDFQSCANEWRNHSADGIAPPGR